MFVVVGAGLGYLLYKSAQAMKAPTKVDDTDLFQEFPITNHLHRGLTLHPLNKSALQRGDVAAPKPNPNQTPGEVVQQNSRAYVAEMKKNRQIVKNGIVQYGQHMSPPVGSVAVTVENTDKGSGVNYHRRNGATAPLPQTFIATDAEAKPSL